MSTPVTKTWYFTIAEAPFVESKFPADGQIVFSQTLISFSVIDLESNINVSAIDAYVEGILAFNNSTFIAPYDGTGSTFSSVSTVGGDGYSFTIDKDGDFAGGSIIVRVVAADVDGGSVDDSWSFLVPDASESIPGTWTGNVAYYSDGYGLKKINLSDMVGECQSVVTTLFDYPTIFHNDILSVSGEVVNDNLCLSICYDDYSFIEGYGVSIIKNEIDIYNYGDGYSYNDPFITNKGILYTINKTHNNVEVYYGADYRGDTTRTPDFIYNTESTPPLFGGEILCLYVENEGSVKLSGGARLFVGTTLGFTRVDTYDYEGVDGYSAGLESYGMSSTFGIVGSGAQYEQIGGTIPRVVSISSDELSTIFVATNDELGNGGLTQITLAGNTKIFFLTQENGLLPSNNIRDVFGKTF